MKKFCIKIGNMYADDICTDNETVNNHFIYRISLRSDNKYATKINEDEVESWNKIIKEILKLETDSNIKFEEVIESEDNN